MKSKVFAVDMRASDRENMLQKVAKLLDALEIGDMIKEKELVAIKLHFGEKGNTAYIRPIFIRQIVDKVKATGAFPFITDANTLYVGFRSNASQHLQTGIENGFAYAVVGAPLTIADGLKGTSYHEVDINLEHIKTAYIGSDIAEADALISVAHFKLHEVSGIGGAMKNVGMGGASRRGKMAQHADISPKVKNKKCIGCGQCLDHCQQQAISLVDRDGKEKAYIDPDKCVGCAECIRVCPQKAIQVSFSKSAPMLMMKIAEYTAAAVKGKEKKSVFINFLTNISPACDCHPSADAPIVRDIGILASTDPVAIDQASIDLVNNQPGLSGSCMETNMEPGGDKVRAVYPHLDWEVQLEHGQKIGLGSRDYDLEWLPNKK